MPTPKDQPAEALPPEDVAAGAAPEPEAHAAPTAPNPKAVGEKRPARKVSGGADRRPKGNDRGNDLKVPYPPSPENVPEGLTDYPASFVRQQNVLLASLFLFLMFYIGAVLFFALVGFWCVWSLKHWPVLKVIGLVGCSVSFLYLVKGFFKHHPVDKKMHIEITEDEHPVLFAFIHRLCAELDAPLPNKVFVSQDVNAAVMPRTSLVNLLVEPKKDLLIGLGLVNCMNLTEFKSVLAHEFGHFSQSAMSFSYVYVANRIIGDLITGEDWFDRVVNWCKQQENALVMMTGYVFGAPLWLGRAILWRVYKVITLQHMAVMRESEFHADLVAVKAAGSDAVVLSLFRLKFGNMCLMQTEQDMAVAMDHKLFSNDMFLHQDRAAEVIRRKRKDSELGVPPALPHATSGKTVRIFNPEDEDVTDDVPEMRRTHPPAHELEDNAKDTFVPAVTDHRSPWILFSDAAELRERMTYKFYRMALRVPKNTDLADAVTVQQFIDNEHTETTYDPKYKGCYDDRPLEPGALAELDGIIRDKPWTADRMEKVLEKLYDGCEEHTDALADLFKEEQALRNSSVGRPSPKLKRQIAAIKYKQDENWEWFKSFDRRVYLLHVQMAAQTDARTEQELVERYRFQLEVQRLYQESRRAFQQADDHLTVLWAVARGEIQVDPDFFGELQRVLRESWRTLKMIIKNARAINLPAMKNFEEGDNLADFILKGKMVPEPPLTYVKGAWAVKFLTQLQDVQQKCFRLHFKSVGGILRLQEEIVTKWTAAREPISAELVGDEVIPAEVIAEVIEAEIVETEVRPGATPPATAPQPAQKPTLAASAHVAGTAPAGSPEPANGAITLSAHSEPPAPPVEHNTFSLNLDELANPEPFAIPRTALTENAQTAAQVISAKAPAPPDPIAKAARAGETAVDVRGPAPTPSPDRVGPTEGSAPQEPEPADEIDLGYSPPPAAPALRSAGGHRPPIKITIVTPGQRSPLAN